MSPSCFPDHPTTSDLAVSSLTKLLDTPSAREAGVDGAESGTPTAVGDAKRCLKGIHPGRLTNMDPENI